jgi:hypothetical protein
LAAYWWIDPPLFQPGAASDVELQKAWQSVPADGWAPPGLLVPRFAHYMLEDWCDCIGFQEKPANAGVLCEEFRQRRRQFWDADLAFHNVDGAFWLMHSRDDRITNCVIGHVQKIRGAAVSWEAIEATA